MTKKVLREHPALFSCGVEHHYILELVDHFGNRRFTYADGLVAFAASSFSYADVLPPRLGDGEQDALFDVASFCSFAWAHASGVGEGGAVLLQYAGVGILSAGDLLRLFPSARFVVLTRDPRANVSSQVVSFANGRTFNRSISLWKECRSATKRLLASHPERVIEIRYENLVSDPVTSLRAVVEFLGYEWDEAVLDFDVPMSVAGADGTVEHRRFKSFDPGMLSKYREALTPAQVSLVEWRCRTEMAELGYAPGRRSIRPIDAPFLIGDTARWMIERSQALLVRARS